MADPTPPGPFLVTKRGGPSLTPAQVRHPRFAATSRGVRLPAGAEPTPLLREEAALLGARDEALLCDLSAARRWGLPLPPWLSFDLADRDVVVAVRRGSHRERRRGVRGRRLTLPDEHLTLLSGQPVTNPARTWVDCAEFMPLEHLVAMGDVIVRRGLADLAELEAMVRWARRRRGVVAARTALGLIDPGSESPSESIVRCRLVLAGLPRPACNVDIVVDGEWLARADMAWLRERVIVEYDGVIHLDEASRRSDAARRNLLQDRGWLVIVFTARDLKHPEAMVALVRSALTSRSGS